MGIQAELLPCAGGERNRMEPALKGMALRWGCCGDAAGMQGDVRLRETLSVPLPLAVSYRCPGTTLDRAAVCLPTSLPTVGKSHIFHNSLGYWLLPCTCVCCQPWMVKRARIRLSEPGRGYYPQTAGLGGGRRLRSLT